MSISPTHTVLRNFEGMLISYPEPCMDAHQTPVPQVATPSVANLVNGRASKIQPANTNRHQRRSCRPSRVATTATAAATSDAVAMSAEPGTAK